MSMPTPPVPVTAPPEAWAETHGLPPEHVDCAIAVMLKIIDGKCKMSGPEREIMARLYDAVRDRPALRLGAESHAMIDAARDTEDEALKMQVYEARVLAETRISRPVMKAFKRMLRDEGVLPPKAPAPLY